MKIVELSDGGDYLGFYTKGHVRIFDFVSAVESQWGQEGIKSEDVRQGFARLIPRKGRDYDLEFLPCKKGIGAFPCTYWDTNQILY